MHSCYPSTAAAPAPKRRKLGSDAIFGIRVGTDELDRLWNLTEDNLSGEDKYLMLVCAGAWLFPQCAAGCDVAGGVPANACGFANFRGRFPQPSSPAAALSAADRGGFKIVCLLGRPILLAHFHGPSSLPACSPQRS